MVYRTSLIAALTLALHSYSLARDVFLHPIDTGVSGSAIGINNAGQILTRNGTTISIFDMNSYVRVMPPTHSGERRMDKTAA